MTIRPTLLLLLSIVIGLSTACQHNKPMDLEESPTVDIDQRLAQANKYIVQSESTQIDEYTKRRGWQMQTLDCGVRLMEYEKGKGAPLRYDDEAIIAYRIDGLDGKPFYTNRRDTVVVGRHRPNIGVDAALLKLHYGSKARIIVPSPQGYGVVGDGENIPTRAVLIYDLTVE